MAEQKESVIIDVKFDATKTQSELERVTHELVTLQSEQKALNKAFKDGEVTAEEYSVRQKMLAQSVAKTAKEQTALISQTKLAKGITEEYGDSLDEERRKLGDLQKAYAAMSKEERDNAEDFRAQIKAQSDYVKSLEANIGDTRRNVGNYTEAIKEGLAGIPGPLGKIYSSFTKASEGANGFKGKVELLGKTGIIAIITGLVTIVTKIAEAFQRSEDRTNELSKAFAPLQGALDLVTKAFDTLADILSNVIVVVLDKISSGIGWLAKKLDALGELMGEDWGLSKAFEAAAENMTKLREAEIAYEKHKRAWVTEEANLNNERAKLMAKYEEKDKYTTSERLNFLEKAVEIEKRIAAEKKKLAEEQLKVLELDSDRAENDAAANNALAAARAAVVQADTEYFQKTKELTAKLVAARKELSQASAADAAAYAKLMSDLEAEELRAMEHTAKDAEAILAKETAAILKNNEEIKAAIKARYDALIEFGLEAERTAEELEFEQLNAAYEQKLLTAEEFELAKALIEKKYAEERAQRQEDEIRNAQDKLKESEAQMMSNAAATTKTFSELYTSLAGDQAEAMVISKAFALTSILITQAQSIANGAQAIAAAAAGAAQAAAATGPAAPVTLAAYEAQMVGSILAVVGSVASTIIQAKQILSQANSVDAGNYSTGGTIPGNSYTGDKLIAHVNSGENIITREQSKRLYDIANGAIQTGGINYEALGATMAAAVAAQPAPVMVYKEYNDFINRVASYDELTKI